AGLALPDLLRARAQRPTPPRGAGRARACILLFMGGGPPQMDTFDLKPDAPVEVRGEFPPAATSVTGTRISSLLPSLAKQAHRYAIIRTVSDEYAGGAHGQSVYLALTGHKNPRVNGDDIRPAGRRGLLDQVRRRGDAVLGRRTMDAHQQRAFDVILAPGTRTAFELNAEPAGVRERYGRHKFGQGVLLARRLVERGVPLVTVFWNGEEVPGGWDLHYKNRERLPPLAAPLDRAFSALLDDLSTRGLLDSTLVVWMGEFGRARLIEGEGVRGYWGRCYSVVLAGAAFDVW